MKTKEELSIIKDEIETLCQKLSALTDEELAEVTGGDVSSANIVGYLSGVMPIIFAGTGVAMRPDKQHSSGESASACGIPNGVILVE